ncbi:acyl transferase [Lutibacter sp. A80]|uniref:LuxE/PaaK family acyltransferase n=1 Tax=Lutibacter sp. A80 TaxID=2918453 RepID=UPI001F05233F|nr:acyl transferase [Lutibacter sp. A80]UMB59376.1 acyl transferase [Lutibacter sp. A80]
MKRNTLFKSHNTNEFNEIALDIFRFQAIHNVVYNTFLKHLKVDINSIQKIEDIPFLPIQFFKTHKIVASEDAVEQIFLSSGTTGMTQSKHYVTDVSIYEESFTKTFQYFYGAIENYTILALLPSYLERTGSSLIYMADSFIKKSNNPKSGFYLNNLEELAKNLQELDKKGEKILLIGVSFALLDLLDKYKFDLKNTIIMETGGMKGKRKELIREELHSILCNGFGVSKIHSEYGMTELLSQGYSKGDGVFECPPWMKILTRDTEDALTILPEGKSGGINVIDLANINSCSFIATQDLGKTFKNNTFEVLGRFDNSDIRGCNLLVL